MKHHEGNEYIPNMLLDSEVTIKNTNFHIFLP